MYACCIVVKGIRSLCSLLLNSQAHHWMTFERVLKDSSKVTKFLVGGCRFLNSNHFSPELPVTIACHDAERSWSTSPEDRTSSPYEEWPNLTVVYVINSCCLEFSCACSCWKHFVSYFLIRNQARMAVIYIVEV